jgi:hypothetical protein
MRVEARAAARHALRSEIALLTILVVTVTIARLVLGVGIIGGYTLLSAAGWSLVLTVGVVYWRRKAHGQRRWSQKALMLFYAAGLAAVTAYPAAFAIGLFNDTMRYAFPDALIAMPIYLAGVITFIHQGLVKLVRSRTDDLARTRRRQVTARWMRELTRAERRPRGHA